MIHVLVPTDFSENSYNALRYATELFKEERCTFHILNAFQTSASNLDSMRNKERGTRLYQSIKGASQKDLGNVIDRIAEEEQNREHSFKTISKADSLANAIGKSVLDLSIRFICMGTHGASGLKSVFLGSNTVDIIRKIDFCPIVAVPSNYSFTLPNTILFATGFEHVYDKYELRPMLQLAKLWKSKIRILHLKDYEKESPQKATAKKTLTHRLGKVPFEMVELEKKDKIANQIGTQVEENGTIGMVAIIDYWHSFIEKLTHEPVVKNVAFQTKVPLLVLPLPK